MIIQCFAYRMRPCRKVRTAMGLLGSNLKGCTQRRDRSGRCLRGLLRIVRTETSCGTAMSAVIKNLLKGCTFVFVSSTSRYLYHIVYYYPVSQLVTGSGVCLVPAAWLFWICGSLCFSYFPLLASWQCETRTHGKYNISLSHVLPSVP